MSLILLLVWTAWPQSQEETPLPLHESGLIARGDWTLVLGMCTGCHSAAIIVQNRLTAEGWEDLIRWMERTQNLQKLDPAMEKQIITYLAEYYGPEPSGRRKPLAAHLLPPKPQPTAKKSDEGN